MTHEPATSNATTLMRFPNGRIWRVKDDRVTAVVSTAGLPDDAEEQLDHLSEVITGSAIGLTDISITAVGPDALQVNGDISEYLRELDAEDEPLETVPLGDPTLPAALVEQYGIHDGHARTAVARAGQACPEEDRLTLPGGREFRWPRDPRQGAFFRLVVDGWELCRWYAHELGGQPIEALTRIFSLAAAGTLPCLPVEGAMEAA